MKEAQAIATLHRIGEDIIAIADYLLAYYAPAEKPEPATKQMEVEEPEPATKQMEVEEPEPTAKLENVSTAPAAIKLEDVRTALAEISRSGKMAEMKALLARFGAARLSDVKAEDYAALLAAAKEVKNA